jgi:hypothetical protein
LTRVQPGVAAASIDGRAVRFEYDNKAPRAQGEKASQDEVCGRPVLVDRHDYKASRNIQCNRTAASDAFTAGSTAGGERATTAHVSEGVQAQSQNSEPQVEDATLGRQAGAAEGKGWLEGVNTSSRAVQGRQASHVADAMRLVMREGASHRAR